MKTHRIIPLAFLFIVSLLIGYRFGFAWEQARKPPEKTFAHVAATAVPALPNGQRSILVVAADRLDARQPQLKGVWLVLYLPGSSHLSFLPIYPNLAPDSPADGELLGAFKVNQVNGGVSLSPGFLKVLESRDFWWSGYILLDQKAIAEIGQAFTQAGTSGIQTLTEADLSALVQPGAQEPQKALFSQAAIYQKLCTSMAHLQMIQNFTDRLKVSPGHIGTDLSKEQVFKDFQSLNVQPGSLSCEFPTLSIQVRAYR